jgi:hypothetical protein
MIRCLLPMLLLALTGCAAPRLENIPLVWMPERHPAASVPPDARGLMSARIKVAPMTQAQDDPKLVGENREALPPRPVTTRDDVAAFVTDRFKKLLKNAGLQVVDADETVVLEGEITQFFVTETNLYVGEVRIRMSATDSAGNALWQGVSHGSSTRFGRSYSAANYYQSLSDALVIATTSLLSDRSLDRAVSGKP